MLRRNDEFCNLVIQDDSLVAAVTAAWSGDVAPGRCRVEVTPATAPHMAEA